VAPSQAEKQSPSTVPPQAAATYPRHFPVPLRQRPSYTWVQADFIKQDVPYHYEDLNYHRYNEDLDAEYGFESKDIDGFRLSGSVALGQYFHLTGRYHQISYKRLSYWEEPTYYEDDLSTVDISQFRLGVGAHHPIFAHTDLIIEVGTLFSRRIQKGDFYSHDFITGKTEEETINDRRSSWGSYLNFGWRSLFIEQVALFQEIRWFSVGGEGGRRALSIAHGIQYFIAPNFALSAGIEMGEKDMLDYEVGLRASF